jgi:hypothetical protein
LSQEKNEAVPFALFKLLGENVYSLPDSFQLSRYVSFPEGKSYVVGCCGCVFRTPHLTEPKYLPCETPIGRPLFEG